jgi:hypothetical protein
LTAAFQPVVAQTMREVGVARQYQELMGHAQAIPFIKRDTFDLDRYIVTKSLMACSICWGRRSRRSGPIMQLGQPHC